MPTGGPRGRWTVEAGLEGVPAGTATFEWALDRQVLLWRVSVANPVPDSLSVISADRDGQSYTQHYFDARGVARIYAMTLEGDTWTLRARPAGFHTARLLAAIRRLGSQRWEHDRRRLGAGRRRTAPGARTSTSSTAGLNSQTSADPSVLRQSRRPGICGALPSASRGSETPSSFTRRRSCGAAPNRAAGSDRCTRWGSSRDSPGARARPPRTARPG